MKKILLAVVTATLALDHAHPSSAVGPAPEWMPPRRDRYLQDDSGSRTVRAAND